MKNVQQMFNDIFGVSPQNVHIYIEKIIKLYDHHKRIIKHLKKTNATMFKKDEYGFLVLSPLDLTMMKEAKQLKRTMKEELKEKPINNVTIAMFSTVKDSVDKERLKELSEYLNGRVPETYPQRIVTQCGQLANIFKDIESNKVDHSSDSLSRYYEQIARDNEGLLKLDTVHIDECIANLSLIEDDLSRRQAFSCLHL
jgi:hypothetical protein